MKEIFKDGFVKNPMLLDENSRDDDLLDLQVQKEDFKSKLGSMEAISLVGLVGEFGVGKSNFLNQIKKDIDEDSKWFEFDAWKYPDRKDLWENFVLEVARQIDKKQFDDTLKRIEGKQNNFLKALINSVGNISNVVNISWLSVIKNFNYFLNTSPAKRTFEVQNILTGIFEKIDEKNIYIIVEDIDRSGDVGIFFLETLNHFLKNAEFDKRVIVIVPISTQNYDKNKDSYIKTLDYSHTFSLKNVKLDKFVNAIFKDELFAEPWTHLKGQMTSFLEGIFKEYPNQITMRILKSILRDANKNYVKLSEKYGEGIDWRLSIMFEVARNLKITDTENGLQEMIRRESGVLSRHLFSALCQCIGEEVYSRGGTGIDNIYDGGNLLSYSFKYPVKIGRYNYKSSENKETFIRKEGFNYYLLSDEYLDI